MFSFVVCVWFIYGRQVVTDCLAVTAYLVVASTWYFLTGCNEAFQTPLHFWLPYCGLAGHKDN